LLLLAINALLPQPPTASWGLFFEVLGKNALFLYVVSECLVSTLYTIPVNGDSAYNWLYEKMFANWLQPHWASAAFAGTFLMVCWGVACIMHVKRWSVKW
jgi:predicted acyltransferase